MSKEIAKYAPEMDVLRSLKIVHIPDVMIERKLPWRLFPWTRYTRIQQRFAGRVGDVLMCTPDFIRAVKSESHLLQDRYWFGVPEMQQPRQETAEERRERLKRENRGSQQGGNGKGRLPG